MTGIGPVAVRCPRVRDRVGEGTERIRFSSAILPPYARRSKSLEVLIPILYLKGVSTGDFEEALIALLGKDAGGLSASTIGRLKDAWSEEYARWSNRYLSAKRYVYFWADGIHVQARLEDDAQCLLVIIGATPEGKKELVGLIDGVRERAQSWRKLLLDLKRRGLAMAPELAVADGALGFWQAVEQVWPKTRGQRCWVHKTANVLNKLPKSQHLKAKRALQECRHQTRADQCWPPLFGALHALAIDDAGGGAGFSLRSLSAFDVERVMNAIQRAVAMPPNEVVVDRAARRKILRKVAPLAAGAEDIHHPVHGRAHVGSPLAAAWLGWRNESLDKRPLVVRQIARVSQVITIVFCSVLMRPHRRSLLRIGPPSLNHKRFKRFNKF